MSRWKAIGAVGIGAGLLAVGILTAGRAPKVVRWLRRKPDPAPVLPLSVIYDAEVDTATELDIDWRRKEAA